VERLPERLGSVDARPAVDRPRALRGDDGDHTELRALREPALGLRGLPQPAGEAQLTERRHPLAQRHAPGGGGDRKRDSEVRARLVDSHPARDVDEDVGGAERDARVAPEHGDDHREPLRVDSGAHAPRHRKVGP